MSNSAPNAQDNGLILGTPSFAAPQTNPFGLTQVQGFSSNPRFADIDGDGDLDAFVGAKGGGDTSFFENTGDASSPNFAAPQTNPFGLADVGDRSIPTLADIDGDGDLDAFVGVQDGNTSFFENTGDTSSPNFAAPQTNPFGLADVGDRSNPRFADIDGDGDLDAFVGVQDGNTRFFRNTGTASSPSFAALQTNPFGLADVGFQSSPTLVDIDGDGDLDAFLGEAFGNTFFFRNNTPLVNEPAFTTNEDTAFTTGNVLGNDSDLDGDTLSVASIDTTGTLGSVTNNGDGTFNYNPNGAFDSLIAGATATDSFTYTISDGNGGTDTATVTVTINGVNDVPVGSPTATLSNTAEDTAIIINDSDLLAGFSDVDAGDVLYIDYLSATNGELVNNYDGTYTFTPSADFNGVVDLTYYVTDGYDFSSEQTLSFSVTPVNDAPIAQDDGLIQNPPNFAAPQTDPFGLTDVGLYNTPIFADIDGDGDQDAFAGNLFGNIFFFENTGDANSPNFAAIQTNPFGLANVGVVSTPTFEDIDEDGDLDAFLGEYPGNTRFFENTGTVNSPSFASGQINPFGLTDVGSRNSPTFADIDDDGDLDAFLGEAKGSTFFFENTTLGLVNDPAFTTNEDTAFITGNVLSNDSDLEGDTLTVASIDTTGTLGLVTNNGDGTFSYNPNGTFESLNDGETATDSFTYTVSDGNGGTDTATVTITINGVTDNLNLPLVAVDDSVTTDEDSLLSGSVFANNGNGADSDPDGDTLTVTEVNGNAGNVGTQITLTSGALLTLNPNGSYSYNPNGQFESLAVGATATDSFSYTIDDGNGGTDTATVTVTINGVNDTATIAGIATAAVTEDASSLNLTASGSLTVSDVDTGESLFNTSVTSATGNLGSLNITNVGAYSYSVPNSAVQSLGVGQTKTETFTVQSVDSTATQNIVVTINGVNDAPIGNNNSSVGFSTNEDTTFTTANVLTNDTDVDTGDVLTVTNLDTTGTLGLVIDNGNGTFSYNPNKAFELLNDEQTATDSFSYTLSDGKGGTSTATVSITITGVTDPLTIDPGILTNVTGYRTETNSFAEGGSMLSLVGTPNNEVGTAIFTFTGTSGLYNLIIGTFDENDGQSKFELIRQGNVVNTIFLNQGFAASLPSNVTMVERILGSSLTITNGDSFTIRGTENEGEPARLDFVRFVPIAGITLTGSNNADLLNGSSGNDTITGNGGNDTLFGGSGNDTIVGSQGNDNLDGGNDNDSLNGSDGNDSISGGSGDDTLIGGTGTDTLNGGDGSDTYNIQGSEANGDVFNDTGTSGTDVIKNIGGLLNLLAFAPSNYTGIEIFDGSGQVVAGDNNSNVINFSGFSTTTGVPTVNGLSGNDLINVSTANAGVTVDGGNGQDTLIGSAFGDTLIGGNDNDRLVGGAGNDLLTGGSGSGTDTFTLAAGQGKDTITDFGVSDLIGLSGGISFSNLSFTGNNIILTSTSEILATLTGVNTTTLAANRFVIV